MQGCATVIITHTQVHLEDYKRLVEITGNYKRILRITEDYKIISKRILERILGIKIRMNRPQ